MKLLVAYATTDGQTRKIARFAADRLAGLGHAVELLNLEDAEGLDLSRFDGAILAGSLHAGGYQKTLVRFATEAAADLAQMPTLFLAVSLSAAGDDLDDWSGLRTCLADFKAATGWTPARVEHVAGAFRFYRGPEGRDGRTRQGQGIHRLGGAGSGTGRLAGRPDPQGQSGRSFSRIIRFSRFSITSKRKPWKLKT